jgi:C1A family cysteine protease
MEKLGMGWLSDNPDFRDFTINSPEVQSLVSEVKAMKKVKSSGTKAVAAAAPALPAIVDLRPFCTPIEDQGGIGSCTANAGVGLLEYFQKRATGSHVEGSRLFLYKTTRNLLHWSGDTGAYLRTTMKAMALCGVCPEEYWPYSDSPVVPPNASVAPFDQEPPAFCYALADNFEAITYYRLDPLGTPLPTVLANVKNYIAAGLPSMFGFTVYQSYSSAGANQGKFPFPKAGEKVVGGHAVVAVGFDDNMVINHPAGGSSTTGALLIRNSWGSAWGMAGYGWIPYEYVLRGIASDFWSLINSEYVNTGNF